MVNGKSAPKDRPILATFKTWPWWTLVEWNGEAWEVKGCNGSKLYAENDLISFNEVGQPCAGVPKKTNL